MGIEVELAVSDHFKSRNSQRMIEALCLLAQDQLVRYAMGRSTEIEKGVLDSQVTRLSESLFKIGSNLAKLVDPNLRPNMNVQINGASGIQMVNGVTPASTTQLEVSRVMTAMESAGIPIAHMSPEMVQKCLDAPDERSKDVIISSYALFGDRTEPIEVESRIEVESTGIKSNLNSANRWI
jgi:hypothetical protein